MICVLVGCGKAKASARCAARLLYTGGLFRASYRYGVRVAAERGGSMAIVSARYGLVNPDAEIDPYDATLADRSKAERALWAERILSEVAIGAPARLELVLLMGATYAEPLKAAAEARGFTCIEPLRGLELGERLASLAAFNAGSAGGGVMIKLLSFNAEPRDGEGKTELLQVEATEEITVPYDMRIPWQPRRAGAPVHHFEVSIRMTLTADDYARFMKVMEPIIRSYTQGKGGDNG